MYFTMIGLSINLIEKNAMANANTEFKINAAMQYMVDFFLVSKACVVKILISVIRNEDNKSMGTPPYQS